MTTYDLLNICDALPKSPAPPGFYWRGGWRLGEAEILYREIRAIDQSHTYLCQMLPLEFSASGYRDIALAKQKTLCEFVVRENMQKKP